MRPVSLVTFIQNNPNISPQTFFILLLNLPFNFVFHFMFSGIYVNISIHHTMSTIKTHFISIASVSCLNFPICLSLLPTRLHIIHLSCMLSCLFVVAAVQSPTRAVLLKMAAQLRGSDHQPPRPGSACSFKRSPLVEAELSEARPSSAGSRSSFLQKKLAEKVK